MMKIETFKSKSTEVEAVQLTADADWETIAEWCGGWVGHDSGYGRIVDNGEWFAAAEDWIVKMPVGMRVLADEDFRDEFQPVPALEGVAGDLRQALEGTTPGPWMRYCLEEPDSKEWIINETTGLELAYLGDVFDNDEQAEATAALIAATPELLARSLARIEQLEAQSEAQVALIAEAYAPSAALTEDLKAVVNELMVANERIEHLEAAIADLGKQAFRCFNTDGECMNCFAPAHAGWFGGNGRHEPGCIVAAAINIAKGGT